MTTLYLIDNSPNRHWQYTKLLDSLNQERQKQEFIAWTTIGSSKEERDVKHTSNANESIEPNKLWQRLTESPQESVFLIDFHLGLVAAKIAADAGKLKAKLEDWQDEGLKEKASRLLDEVDETFREEYFHAVFACAILKARGVPAIVISAHQDGYTSGDLETTLIKSWGLGHAASLSTTDAWSAWATEIKRIWLHPNPALRKILVAYHNPAARDANAWQHDWCEKDEGIAHGHSVLSVCCFDQDNLVGIESSENKAFHMRNDDTWALVPAAGYLVCKSSLTSALKALEITAEVKCTAFRFPVSPGLAFLISLKELLLACLDDKGQGEPTTVELFTDGDNLSDPVISGVRIQLSATNEHGLNLVKRLIWKLEKSKSDETGPKRGLCRAVWNLGHCRSGDIRPNGEPWAEMFSQGSLHWVAWPSFSKDTITFHW